MSGTTYYQRNTEVILNRAIDYYENNKELSRERAKNKCRELSGEERKYKKRVWKKKDIIACLKKRKKPEKNIKKIIVRLKTYFTNADMPIKVHYKIAIAKIFLFVLL